METKKREFIDPNDLMDYINENHCYSGLPMAAHICTMELLTYAPRVDAVTVDEIIFHHILIDENGIPEVKLQLGDRTLVLRREDDPVVDVKKVIYAQWMLAEDNRLMCSNCKHVKVAYEQLCYFNSTGCWNYCPNCGAEMNLK